MRLKIGILILFAMLLIEPAVAGAQPSRAREQFSLATEAFREGLFEQALSYFRAAEEAGMESHALHYNLGVTYYKLARYDEARQEFERLTTDPQNAPLAHYNLGRIALATGDNATARKQFKITSRTAQNEKLQILAADRLRELTTLPKARRWSGYLYVAGGHDDNVTLDVDSEVQVEKVEDNFMELIWAATVQLSGTRENGLRLRSTGYFQNYFDADEYDFGNLRVGPEFDHSFGEWDTSLSGYVDWSIIDRDLFERILTMELEGSRKISPNIELGLEYRLGFVNAEFPYEDLTGSQQQITAELRSQIFDAYTRFGYTLELNDRDNLDYPTRHSVGLMLSWNLGDVWAVEAAGNFRYSDYKQSDRKDDRLRLSARISRTILWDVSAFGEYEFTRNDSNYAEDEYTSNIVAFGLERFF